LSKQKSKQVERDQSSWKKTCLQQSTAKVPLRKEKFITTSGIEMPDLFLPSEETFSVEYFREKIGFPGQFPFTRGVQPSMYRGQLWTIRQYSGFGTAIETNKRYHYLMQKGTTGLSVAFDLPTQMGRDSDHRLSKGEVGRVGVAIDSIEDMQDLFSGISLDKISTSMTINSTAHILLALYLAVAKSKSISWDKLRGTIQNDVLKEYIARGTYIYPPKHALKITTDLFEFCQTSVPQWNTISISGYHIREAGSSAVQELAFTLSNAIAYVESALKRGLEIDSFAPRIAFFFNSHNNFLEEIAKFRAARRLWAKIMRDRFQAKNDKSLMLRFHTQTAGSTLTAQEPLNNAVRTAIQGMAAIIGGTQSLHTNGYDEALCLPSEEAALLALRTQQVMAFESGLADVVDPFAGSYCIEALTDEIEKKTLAMIDKIDSLGGMVVAIENDFPQKEIEESAYSYQRSVDNQEVKIAGLGSENKGVVKIEKVNPEREFEQVKKLDAFKQRRNSIELSKGVDSLKAAVSEDRNIMPDICNLVELGATVGEISDVLRDKYGEYRQ
jgi:methylmalonyl-CoA mutase, N-terminal domain